MTLVKFQPCPTLLLVILGHCLREETYQLHHILKPYCRYIKSNNIGGTQLSMIKPGLFLHSSKRHFLQKRIYID